MEEGSGLYEDHTEGENLRVGYQWKYREHWNRLTVDADAVPAALPPESKEEFITEHFWGYASMGPASCGEYEVRLSESLSLEL